MMGAPSTVAPTKPIVHIDILDVGHGSCVVVRAQGTVHLIDTGPNGAILEYLRAEGIQAIDTVIISHADTDHIGGLSALLSNGVPLQRVLWNGDSAKRSKIWRDLVYQLDDLRRSGSVITDEEATDNTWVTTDDPAVAIRLLAPRLRLRRLGPGAVDASGAVITSNAVSVVAQVRVDDEGVVLVTGDLDDVGYSHLVDPAVPDLQSRHLLLPHHGGLMGSPAATVRLARELVKAVKPEVIFVSNGRNKYDNPRPEVVAALRDESPRVSLSCTQLSRRCSSQTVDRGADATALASAGWQRGRSCAATVRLERGRGIGASLDRTSHEAFIDSRVATPLCRKDAI